MTTTYLDTSAALKLIVDEAESESLVDELTSNPGRRLVASWLLHTELHCAAGRHPQAVTRESVRSVLDTVNLVDVTRGDMIAAGTHTPLRSGDAIHLTVAMRLGVDEMLTYDHELAGAADQAGLRVVTPGRGPSRTGSTNRPGTD